VRPRYHLDLRVDAPGPDGDGPVELSAPSQRVRVDVYRQLGLKAHSGRAWVTVDLASARGWDITQKLLATCRAGRAVVGSALAREQTDDDGDWSQLHTRTADGSFSLWDDYPSYRAGTHPEGHALNGTFVSAAFVAAYERAGLTGLSFLRCRNRGRKAGPAWFAALPDHSLGHGLDHPWFDRRRWIRDVGDDPSQRASSLDSGQYQFHQCWLRDQLGADADFVRRLLELCPMPRVRTPLRGLQFVTVPRYWAPALPHQDFAHIRVGEDGPNREGKVLRFRQLAVSRRARRTLLDAGLFAPASFRPVRSVAVPEAGVEVLDERHDPVPPMYGPQELEALRAQERTLFGPPRGAW
jgi:hypothetical protein